MVGSDTRDGPGRTRNNRLKIPMLASITIPSDVPGMIALLKRIGYLATDWAPPEGIVFLALWAWLLMIMLMVYKFMK